MNVVTRDNFYKQARKHAIWASAWLVVALSAMFTKPETPGIQQWASEQAMFVAGFLMIFQFGRMFQCLSNMKRSNSLPTVPAWVSLEAEAEAIAKGEAESFHFQARDIRAFASIGEAAQHGWEFGETIANFGGEPVPRIACFNGHSYVFDGLSPDHVRASVPTNQRQFGRLCYKLIEKQEAPPDPSSPVALSS